MGRGGGIPDRLKVRSRLNERLPSWIKIGFFTIHLKTQYGIDFIEYIGQRFKRLLRGWNYGAAAVLVVLMVAMLYSLGFGVQNPEQADVTPESDNLENIKNVLIIPGINDLIPMSSIPYLLFSILIVVCIHELGHAFAAAAEGITIEEMGFILLFGLIPIAGYMRPDEEELENAPPGSRIRVGAAGIIMNVLMFLVMIPICIVFFVEPLIMMVAVMMDIQQMAGILEASTPLARVTFWLLFLNFNLALFNAIPVRFLDGGIVFHGIIDGAAQKVGYESEAGIEVIVAIVSIAVFVALIYISL